MTDAMSAYYDPQYNARAMIPDHARIFERWKTRSQEARANLPCRLDISYGAAAEKARHLRRRGQERSPAGVHPRRLLEVARQERFLYLAQLSAAAA